MSTFIVYIQLQLTDKGYRAKTKVNRIRYADDFIITADSKEIAEDLKLLVSDFLQSRGLQRSEEKTIITHIDNGFDFLGWSFRKFKGKLIVKPSKDSVKQVVRKLSNIILGESKASTQVDLIRRLNLVIRGWSNYHKHTIASKTFSNVNNTIYLLLQRWAKHRHPNKTNRWRLTKYWHRCGDKPWLFSTTENARINLRTIPIVRHPNLQLTKNPFLDQRYFEIRKQKIRMLNAA